MMLVVLRGASPVPLVELFGKHQAKLTNPISSEMLERLQSKLIGG